MKPKCTKNELVLMSKTISNVEQKIPSEKKAYLKPNQTSMIEFFFEKIANNNFRKKDPFNVFYMQMDGNQPWLYCSKPCCKLMIFLKYLTLTNHDISNVG